MDLFFEAWMLYYVLLLLLLLLLYGYYIMCCCCCCCMDIILCVVVWMYLWANPESALCGVYPRSTPPTHSHRCCSTLRPRPCPRPCPFPSLCLCCGCFSSRKLQLQLQLQIPQLPLFQLPQHRWSQQPPRRAAVPSLGLPLRWRRARARRGETPRRASIAPPEGGGGRKRGMRRREEGKG